jgi:hypothetical protein
MTTVDGQTIPLQLMTHDDQHITTEMESQLQHVGVENSEAIVSAITVSMSRLCIIYFQSTCNTFLYK